MPASPRESEPSDTDADTGNSDNPDTGNSDDPDTVPNSACWTRIPAADTPSPIVVHCPYVEVSLVHPDLPATRVGGSFYPSALPYVLGDERRVFYWRDALSGRTPVPEGDWSGVCATPDHLVPIGGRGSGHGDDSNDVTLDLAPPVADGHEVVVDATIAGDSTTARVQHYRPPTVTVRELTEHAAEVSVDGRPTVVPVGERTRIPTESQSVQLLEPPADGPAPGADGPTPGADGPTPGADGPAPGVDGPAPEAAVDSDTDPSADSGERAAVETTPEIVVRYPGTRTVFHPAPGSDVLVFPSFGVDLDAVPRQLPVDPDGVDRDLDAIADAMGADRSTRPYAERVLWEAFVYAAFDPDRTAPVGLTQFENGLLAVHDPPDSMR